MHELRNPVDLAAFYRFSVKYPEAWAALEKQRLEHSKLGSGTLERFIPSVDSRSESVIEVRFDALAGSDADSRPKRLAARVVFDNNLLESLAVPPSLLDRFRTFTIQVNWKKDWRKFEEVLKEHRIDRLYHFTDPRNLDSIRKHGGCIAGGAAKRRASRSPRPVAIVAREIVTGQRDCRTTFG